MPLINASGGLKTLRSWRGESHVEGAPGLDQQEPRPQRSELKDGSRLRGLRIRVHCVGVEARRIAALVA
jgi:hypothetical protein